MEGLGVWGLRFWGLRDGLRFQGWGFGGQGLGWGWDWLVSRGLYQVSRAHNRSHTRPGVRGPPAIAGQPPQASTGQPPAPGQGDLITRQLKPEGASHNQPRRQHQEVTPAPPGTG